MGSNVSIEDQVTRDYNQDKSILVQYSRKGKVQKASKLIQLHPQCVVQLYKGGVNIIHEILIHQLPGMTNRNSISQIRQIIRLMIQTNPSILQAIDDNQPPLQTLVSALWEIKSQSSPIVEVYIEVINCILDQGLSKTDLGLLHQTSKLLFKFINKKACKLMMMTDLVRYSFDKIINRLEKVVLSVPNGPSLFLWICSLYSEKYIMHKIVEFRRTSSNQFSIPYNGQTPLIILCKRCFFDAAQLLVQCNWLNIEYVEYQTGRSALHYATGCDFDLENSEYDHYFGKFYSESLALMLLNKMERNNVVMVMNRIDSQGYTPLLNAEYSEMKDVLRLYQLIKG